MIFLERQRMHTARTKISFAVGGWFVQIIMPLRDQLSAMLKFQDMAECGNKTTHICIDTDPRDKQILNKS